MLYYLFVSYVAMNVLVSLLMVLGVILNLRAVGIEVVISLVELQIKGLFRMFRNHPILTVLIQLGSWMVIPLPNLLYWGVVGTCVVGGSIIAIRERAN